ncbi:uncharacterized protein L969DRAFT_558160 [Mixia osmundae IAM 14324]|uniref:Uncharacterized protein n=1 Tax=Mixia osmundae (strain CBS 9802 / IAM 14324 / JCM 22182 / KY 12970) TaxID=764103 RepID=G7DSH7_MIXOS|nr:uncharacterized protein L969DRAFT_558160 [Mixia osmundae IAM 14324]KEI37965.1 hypothetical protein L969DRAFT_558160 [Mixia osmundae IAM 14324]GAA93537.1 hypothetical protein E5Q_00181 [Mixia osmundae IAM 14324]
MIDYIHNSKQRRRSSSSLGPELALVPLIALLPVNCEDVRPILLPLRQTYELMLDAIVNELHTAPARVTHQVTLEWLSEEYGRLRVTSSSWPALSCHLMETLAQRQQKQRMQYPFLRMVDTLAALFYVQLVALPLQPATPKSIDSPPIKHEPGKTKEAAHDGAAALSRPISAAVSEPTIILFQQNGANTSTPRRGLYPRIVIHPASGEASVVSDTSSDTSSEQCPNTPAKSTFSLDDSETESTASLSSRDSDPFGQPVILPWHRRNVGTQ